MYYLGANATDYCAVYDNLTFRLSLFAKEHTKSYSRGERSFVCSH
ncbi:inovirus-type Gp2 protein [Enterobacter hormaechei]|nr:inovirus-type Gp2 protein [Enterobacter hormaechei]